MRRLGCWPSRRVDDGPQGSRRPLPREPRPIPRRRGGASGRLRARVPGRPACAAGAGAAGDLRVRAGRACVSARVCMYMCTRAGTPTCAESCVHAQLGVHTRVQRQHRRAWAEGVAQRAGWTLGRFREALEGQVASPWPPGDTAHLCGVCGGNGGESGTGGRPEGEAVTEIAPGGLT